MFSTRWHLQNDLDEAQIESDIHFGHNDVVFRSDSIFFHLDGELVFIRVATKEDRGIVKELIRARRALDKCKE